MTTDTDSESTEPCPAQPLMKMLGGKFKPEIVRLAHEAPVRFNNLLRQLEGSNKQSVATALKELHDAGILDKTIVSDKPLHIEYSLSEKGQSLVRILADLEKISGGKPDSFQDK